MLRLELFIEIRMTDLEVFMLATIAWNSELAKHFRFFIWIAEKKIQLLIV